MFFSRKKEKDEKSANEILLRSLNGRAVRYVTRRDPKDYGETILGKDGIINIFQDKLTISCGEKLVFEHGLDSLEGGELMSLEGINLSYKEMDSNGKIEVNTVVAYYKYYRK